MKSTFFFRQKSSGYTPNARANKATWGKEHKHADILKNFCPDYAVQIYFKGEPGRKSRYSMGELVEHFTKEGQYSKAYEKTYLQAKGHHQAPLRSMVVRQSDFQVNPNTNKLTDKGKADAQEVMSDFNARWRKVRSGTDPYHKVMVDRNGKYILRNTRKYKKVWDFVGNAVKKHHGWARIIHDMANKIIRDTMNQVNARRRHGESNVNPSSIARYINFRYQMQRLGERIVKNIKEALYALEAPPLDRKTIKKKGHDQILIESHKMINSIAYKVVKIDAKPKTQAQKVSALEKSMEGVKSWVRLVVNGKVKKFSTNSPQIEKVNGHWQLKKNWRRK